MGGDCGQPSDPGSLQSRAGFLVQVRYPDVSGWVSIAAADDRSVASARAGALFHDARSPTGRAASQVRVISEAELLATGGAGAVRAAWRSLGDASPGAARQQADG